MNRVKLKVSQNLRSIRICCNSLTASKDSNMQNIYKHNQNINIKHRCLSVKDQYKKLSSGALFGDTGGIPLNSLFY